VRKFRVSGESFESTLTNASRGGRSTGENVPFVLELSPRYNPAAAFLIFIW
jgi:hypothetical protein